MVVRGLASAAAAAGSPLVLESDHPHARDTHEATLVAVPGAARLAVTFAAEVRGAARIKTKSIQYR